MRQIVGSLPACCLCGWPKKNNKYNQHTKSPMKKQLTWCAAALLAVGSASAATITVTDGTGNTYGAAVGIGIDFDSSLTPATAPWTPTLVSGLTYSVNSVSLRDGGAAAGPVYLGVYTGNSLGVFTGFLGSSLNSVDFSTVADGTFATFNFNSISVTADNVAGSGSGLLYFGFQSSQSDSGNALLTRAMHRIDGFGTYSVADYGNNVLAYGTMQTTRALEFQSVVTAVPEPTSLALFGLSGMALVYARRRSMK